YGEVNPFVAGVSQSVARRLCDGQVQTVLFYPSALASLDQRSTLDQRALARKHDRSFRAEARLLHLEARASYTQRCGEASERLGCKVGRQFRATLLGETIRRRGRPGPSNGQTRDLCEPLSRKCRRTQ